MDGDKINMASGITETGSPPLTQSGETSVNPLPMQASRPVPLDGSAPRGDAMWGKSG